MAQECAICGKTKNIAWRLVKLRGKYNPTVKHSQKPNLQWMPLPASKQNGISSNSGRRVKACTKCIKAAAKQNK